MRNHPEAKYGDGRATALVAAIICIAATRVAQRDAKKMPPCLFARKEVVPGDLEANGQQLSPASSGDADRARFMNLSAQAFGVVSFRRRDSDALQSVVQNCPGVEKDSTMPMQW